MDLPDPPLAQRRPVRTEMHGVTLIDDYAWLRNRDDPAVIAHLEAENTFTDAVMGVHEQCTSALYDEIASRIVQTDATVPARLGDWWYVTRTTEGLQYPTYCRRAGGPDGAEEVVLDQNVLAEGHDFCALGGLTISDDGTRLAYSLDDDGGEVYTVRLRDLGRGVDLDDVITGVTYGLAWTADGGALYYTRPDAAMRAYQVWRHVVGTDPATDVLVVEEPDDRFNLHLAVTKSRRFVLVVATSHMTSEIAVIARDRHDAEPVVMRPRVDGVEYDADHDGDRFVIITNADAHNFAVVTAPTDDPGAWTTLIAHRDDVRVDDVDVFGTHLVVTERTGGSLRLSVRDRSGSEVRIVAAPDAAGTIGTGENHELDSTFVRVHYTSLAMPPTVFDEDLATGERVTRKVLPVHNYDAGQFETHRLWATAADGVRIPISLVARNDVVRDGTAPMLLYGYGSYEACIDPQFNPMRVNLLERGWVFAVAHVRGGGEMGRPWYEDGKLFRKRNTFTDFVACAEHLVAEGWTSPARLAIRGRSAGGLLMGATLNLRPDLFHVVVAEVPFVDVINTMLDASLPLTVPEWEEWGNPHEPEAFTYMRSYSPYDNVAATAYPHILATGGLHDPRVAFWEPAKWVARLRERRTNDRLLLLKMEMGAGHMGPTGRYNAWREEAFVQSFLLAAMDLP